MSLILTDAGEKLEITATVVIPFTVHYADYVGATPVFTPGVTGDDTINGTKDLLVAPGSGQRVVRTISVHNDSGGSDTITIQLDDGGVNYTIMTVALPDGYTLCYDEDGWKVLDGSGALVTVLPTHAVLGPHHSDAATDAVTRGSLIYGNATPQWDELVHPGTAYHLQTSANDVVWAQNITMADGSWQGIGAALERIVFDAAGDIAVMGANFGVGTLAPAATVHAYSLAGISEILAESDATTLWAQFTQKNELGHALYLRTYGSTAAGSDAGQARADWASILTSNLDGLIIDTLQAVPIIFGTLDTERMRIEGTGRVVIGHTASHVHGQLTLVASANDQGYMLQETGGGDKLFHVHQQAGDDCILRLYSNNVQTIQIHSLGTSYFNGGDVGIGIAPSFRLDVYTHETGYAMKVFNDGDNNANDGILIYCGADTNPTADLISFRDGNATVVGYIIGDGAGGVTYHSASDERLKNILGTIDQELVIEALNSINPIQYVGKGLTEKTGCKNFGFSAQDVHRYFPEIAIHDEETDSYTMAYERLVPILWTQNQALLERIEQLEVIG